MSQPATVSTGSDRRTIGAILRSHGYVTDVELQEAADVQARTGKPLGQVLVEAGVITRLELASALAEQWSDSSGWMQDDLPGTAPHPTAGIGLTAQRREAEDAVLATRLSAVEIALQEVLRSEPSTSPLEHAVADLARRVTTWEPTLAELERRTDAAVDTDALESHLTELAETIDAAFQRSDAATATLAELGARLDDVQLSFPQARNDLGHSTGAAAAEVARLAAELVTVKRELSEKEPTVAAAEVADLRGQLETLVERPARDHELAARVTQLAARLETLAAHPQSDPHLADRLDRVAELVAVLTADSRLAELQASVADLASRLSERPELVDRVEELARRVDALVVDAGRHVAGDVPDELRSALEELAARPPLDEALAARVDEIARQMSALPDERDFDALRAAVTAMGPEGRSNDSISAVTSELQDQIRAVAGQLAELQRGDDIRGLRDAVEELSSRPAGDPSLGDRLWRLAERVDALVDAAASGRGVDRSELAEVRASVAALAAQPAGDPERLERVGARLDGVARQVDDLGRALAALPSDRQEVSPDAIAALEARLDDVGQRVTLLGDATASAQGTDAVPDDILARLDGTDRTTDELSTELSRTAEIWYAGRAALEARLEELEARVAARPAPTRGSGASATVPHVIEQEVERVLMAVERLGLHLSEHDRALAELMSRRGSSKVEELAARVDELETYGVAAGAVVVGPDSGADGAAAPVSMANTRDLRAELRSLSRQVTELEDTSKSDREKFLTQLERMASSIDWRIRRIESGESAS